jgi:hypothetical protein
MEQQADLEVDVAVVLDRAEEAIREALAYARFTPAVVLPIAEVYVRVRQVGRLCPLRIAVAGAALHADGAY